MPWGWECRSKLIKQVPHKPTKRRETSGNVVPPGPGAYEPPHILGGKGFSKIKRLPAYSFGLQIPASLLKPAATPGAPLFNIRDQSRKGQRRVPGSLITPHIEPLQPMVKVPGPGAYDPTMKTSYRRPPAYTMSSAAKLPYQPWDQWTPPPNMYCPPIPAKKPPAYSLRGIPRDLPQFSMPGPGEHNANFQFSRRTAPKFSFGAPFRSIRLYQTPPPNAYCDKRFMTTKRTIPALSFGIKHSPYIGEQEAYLKSDNLKVAKS